MKAYWYLIAQTLLLLLTGCGNPSGVTLPVHPETPRESIREFKQPFAVVWIAAEHVLNGKQAFPVLVDREAGLLRFALQDWTNINIMVYVKALDPNRTKVYVRRSRGAETPVRESAILDEIQKTITSPGR